MSRADVVVVGAGPAGAALAILLASRGRSTVLLAPPRLAAADVWGEYLSPEAARVLDRLGVLKDVDAAGAQPLRGMRIATPDGTALVGRYPTAGPWRGYRDHALGIRREVLDRVLIERARSLPVDVRDAHRVTGLRIDGDQVTGVEGVCRPGHRFRIESRLVVGADDGVPALARALGLVGSHRVRRLALAQDVERPEGFGEMAEIYVDPPDWGLLHPVAPGLATLSVVVPMAHARPYRGRLAQFFHARLKQFRQPWPRLEGLRMRGPVTALGPEAQRVSAPRHGGVLLAGEAGGLRGPFHGPGIFAALRSAEMIADVAHSALERGDLSARGLAAYAERRRAAGRDRTRMARALDLLSRHRRLANLAAGALARHPRLCDALVGAMGDFVPPRALLRPSAVPSLL
jgi:flavin-dependent dehydrogenase